MGALDDARAHLAKAQEFLAAAELTLDLDLFNAATSSAVSSGINSKDAICLRLTGVSRKTDNHAQAVAELTQAGGVGAALTQTFSRLLRMKPQTSSCRLPKYLLTRVYSLRYDVVNQLRYGKLYPWVRGSWRACRNRRFCA